jgi:hypothetical protein
MRQVNLKLSDNLFRVAQNYVESFGFRNIQDLANEAIREKVFENNDYDENFSKEEVELIDKLISVSVKKNSFVSEEELNKVLLG